MYSVTIIDSSGRQTVSAAEGQPLSELLHQYVPAFSMPCAGNHTCGKCRVEISGAVSPMGDEEKTLLGSNVSAASRLACFCSVQGDLTVTLHNEGNSEILSGYQIPNIAPSTDGYGFAVDIGTTTVAMQLIHRPSGTVAAEILEENVQRSYGADVISRIDACSKYGAETLSDLILTQLEKMAAACIEKAGISSVEESVITGNSTMLHIFEGLDPFSLAVAPFSMVSSFGCQSRHTLANAPVYLPRCIGAYVGADTLCAILASGMSDDRIELLSDIGTNGEIALMHHGTLLCCSTAAGPAFEGAGLSHGMPARTGAICAVECTENSVQYRTIGDVLPIGICGSGILDALSVMLDTEVMEDSGYIEESWNIGNSNITVTQKDIRQIQLAKAAVCAGILTLLDHANLSADDVARFILAGGLGNSMNPASAVKIGLFPAALADQCDFIGNGALGGAVMLLQNPQLRKQSAMIAEKAIEVPLSGSTKFNEYYIDCMMFESV